MGSPTAAQLSPGFARTRRLPDAQRGDTRGHVSSEGRGKAHPTQLTIAVSHSNHHCPAASRPSCIGSGGCDEDCGSVDCPNVASPPRRPVARCDTQATPLVLPAVARVDVDVAQPQTGGEAGRQASARVGVTWRMADGWCSAEPRTTRYALVAPSWPLPSPWDERTVRCRRASFQPAASATDASVVHAGIGWRWRWWQRRSGRGPHALNRGQRSAR